VASRIVKAPIYGQGTQSHSRGTPIGVIAEPLCVVISARQDSLPAALWYKRAIDQRSGMPTLSRG
jgi:hypothetical protein